MKGVSPGPEGARERDYEQAETEIGGGRQRGSDCAGFTSGQHSAGLRLPILARPRWVRRSDWILEEGHGASLC